MDIRSYTTVDVLGTKHSKTLFSRTTFKVFANQTDDDIFFLFHSTFAEHTDCQQIILSSFCGAKIQFSHLWSPLVCANNRIIIETLWSGWVPIRITGVTTNIAINYLRASRCQKTERPSLGGAKLHTCFKREEAWTLGHSVPLLCSSEISVKQVHLKLSVWYLQFGNASKRRNEAAASAGEGDEGLGGTFSASEPRSSACSSSTFRTAAPSGGGGVPAAPCSLIPPSRAAFSGDRASSHLAEWCFLLCFFLIRNDLGILAFQHGF